MHQHSYKWALHVICSRTVGLQQYILVLDLGPSLLSLLPCWSMQVSHLILSQPNVLFILALEPLVVLAHLNIHSLELADLHCISSCPTFLYPICLWLISQLCVNEAKSKALNLSLAPDQLRWVQENYNFAWPISLADLRIRLTSSFEPFQWTSYLTLFRN